MGCCFSLSRIFTRHEIFRVHREDLVLSEHGALVYLLLAHRESEAELQVGSKDLIHGLRDSSLVVGPHPTIDQ